MSFISSQLFNQSRKLILTPSFKRFLCLSNINRKIFTVQDEEDFEERVVKSEVPVIVQFKAP